MDTIDLGRKIRRQEPEELTFKHLYDDKWGVIVKPRHEHGEYYIIMPTPGNFMPTNKQSKFNCLLKETKGQFTFERKYKLVLAELANAAEIKDVINYRVKSIVSNHSGLGSMAAALGNINLKLKSAHAIFPLKVIVDQKNGGYMLEPQFTRQDSACGGRPSRRFFILTQKDQQKLLDIGLGQMVHCRENSVTPTKKVSLMGEVRVEVNVSLL